MLGRILVFIGGLLVLVLFAALIVPYFIDWSNFSREFEAQASRALGKKVEVTGDVDVRILPFPSITLHDVRVGRDADGKPLATADAFSMDAELAPFLSGEVRVFKMALDKPVLNLTIDEDGVLSWTNTGAAGLASRRVVFEDVTVRDGELHLNDVLTGRVRTLSDIDASLSSNALAGPWRMEGSAALDDHAANFGVLTGRPDPETGAMRLRLSVTPEEWPVASTFEGDVSLKDGRPVYAGTFRLQADESETANAANDADGDAEQAPPPPRASGTFELTNDSFKVSEYRLEIGSRVDPYVISGEGDFDTRPGGSFLLTANGQQFDIERLSDYGANEKKGRVSSSNARQRLDALIGFLRQVPIPQLPGKVTFRLPALVAGDTTIRSVVLDARPDGDGWQIENASAELPGRTQVEASGRLALGEGDATAFDGALLVASRQPTGLSQWLTGMVGPEIRALSRAGFSADVSLTRESQVFDNLQVVAGDAVLNGSLARRDDGSATPELDVDLSGNVIDLAALRALAGLMIGGDVDAGLNQHKITASIKADTLNAFDLTAKAVDAAFTYQAGSVAIDNISIGDLAGAKLMVTGQAQTGDSQSGSARVSLAAADISAFVETIEDRFGDYPALTMLKDSSLWYQNTDLSADLTFGDDGKSGSVVFRGTSNGSKIAGSWRLDGLAADAAMSGQIQVSNTDAAVIFGQAGLSPLPIPGPAGGQFSLTVERPAGGAPATLTLRASSGDTRLTASGEGSLAAADFLSGHYDVSVSSPDLEPYLAMNALAVPGTAFGVPVSLKSALDITADDYRLTGLTGTVDSNGVAGQLALARGTPVTRIDGQLSLDSLDLAWLMEAIYGPNFTTDADGLSGEPFGDAYFGTAEARIDVQAGSFDPGLFGPITGMSGTVDFRGGGLSLDNLAGGYLGGTLAGDMRLGNTNGDGYFQAQLNIADAALPDAVWKINGTPVVKGRFDLGLVAESTAKSAAGLLDKVSGSGMLTLKDATVTGLDFAVVEPLLEWADKQGTEIDNEAIEAQMRSLVFDGSAFDIASVAVPFSMTDGVLSARNVFVDLPEAQLYGALRSDLAQRDIDATLEATLKLGDEAEEGASAGFVLGFNGPLGSPLRSFDLTEVNNYLALRAVERERARVERLQADILEKQRLRREASLYRYREEQRRIEAERKAAEEERLRQEEEARRAAEEAAEQADRDTLLDSILKGAQEFKDGNPSAPPAP
ncbi:AsmA family protein [Martelella endophytica]|uniref:AsmA family protein n=1 Tax=Martelella endophytica TaxID=1486262 RepID=UPI0005F12475|nr:AsmA family protein [Martelella endophytica]